MWTSSGGSRLRKRVRSNKCHRGKVENSRNQLKVGSSAGFLRGTKRRQSLWMKKYAYTEDTTTPRSNRAQCIQSSESASQCQWVRSEDPTPDTGRETNPGIEDSFLDLSQPSEIHRYYSPHQREVEDTVDSCTLDPQPDFIAEDSLLRELFDTSGVVQLSPMRRKPFFCSVGAHFDSSSSVTFIDDYEVKTGEEGLNAISDVLMQEIIPSPEEEEKLRHMLRIFRSEEQCVFTRFNEITEIVGFCLNLKGNTIARHALFAMAQSPAIGWTIEVARTAIDMIKKADRDDVQLLNHFTHSLL